MWRGIGTSIIGTSHVGTGTPCQDACDYRSCILGTERVFLIAIADGAGSAAASDIGSREAVDHLLNEISHCGRSLLQIDLELVEDWMLSARKRLEEVARNNQNKVRDLACTLMFAALGERCCIFGQVGDGAWVAQKDGFGYDAATWPSGGEYANQTTFITSPNWKDVLQFVVLPGSLSHVAGFTDGLQHLALHFQSRTVHAPFFDPKFKALRSTYDETSLRAPLMDYLSSSAICERTDDDKTLVLACRTEVKLLADAIR